jgi:pyruvate formate-lyase activating enzyme-like uncharacterized protein
MFINGLCTASCFFCPKKQHNKKNLPEAEKIIFDKPSDYAEYLERFGFKGMGVSGGECLLVFDRLLSFLEAIRKRLGTKIYLWIYTNGDLLNNDKLKRLKQVGLDEIRFNICARNYNLKPVKLATKYIKTVTVEIPAIPEDYEKLKKSILRMQDIGVKYLNLHQLFATAYNCRHFIKRHYTFTHLIGSKAMPIFESEMTALKIMKYAIDNNIKVAINYCTLSYKQRLQNRGYRRRAGYFAREDFEEFTDAGFIRRLSVQDSPYRIKKIIRDLRKDGCQKSLWLPNTKKTRLHIHHSLLKYIDFKKSNLVISYFEPKLKASLNSYNGKRHRRIRLSSTKRVFIDKEPLGKQAGLSPIALESFCKRFIEHVDAKHVFEYFFKNYKLEKSGALVHMKKEIEILAVLETWEKLKRGFPEIIDGRSENDNEKTKICDTE